MNRRFSTAALGALAAAFAGCALGAAPTALAQGPSNPLSPGVPLTTPTVTTAPAPAVTNVTTTTSGTSGLSSAGAIAIAVGAVVLLGGISVFIWRDARRRAPTRHRAATATAGSPGGSKPRAKPRKLSPAERRRRKRGRAR